MRKNDLVRSGVVGTILASCLVFTACEKELNTPLGGPEGCGTDGLRLEATFGTSDLCASSNLTAHLNGELNIIGISGINTTIEMQLSDLVPGDHQVTENVNTFLILNNGGVWLSSDSLPGLLTIIAHDTVANAIEAYFNVPMVDGTGSVAMDLSGSIEVSYND